MQVAGNETVGASAAPSDTGFAQPFAGDPQYEHLGPTEVLRQGQINRPIRQRAADEIAKQLGLSKADAFTR